MYLYEEFKLYENLWTNPDGVEIDLEDPVAFQKELEDEKKRYQTKRAKELTTYGKNRYGSMHKLSKDVSRSGRTIPDTLDREIKMHMAYYEKDLKDHKYLTNPDKAVIPDSKIPLGTREYNHKKYDITNETQLIDYINSRVWDKLGTPSFDKIKSRLTGIKKELAPMLARNGYKDLADKVIAYTNEQIDKAKSISTT